MVTTETDSRDKAGIANDWLGAFSWVQEHANLCSVAVLCGADDHETRARLREQIALSLERGTRLVDVALGHLGSAPAHSPIAISGNHSHSPLGRTSYVPTSGAHRFDEGMVGRVRVMKPPTHPDCAPHELLPSRNYVKTKSEPKKVS